MSIGEKDSLLHWNYFLAIESDLEKVSRHIEFTEKNYKVYSIELSHLLLAAASEVDVVAKGICKFLDENSRARNISGYKKIIINHLLHFVQEEVFVPRKPENRGSGKTWFDAILVPDHLITNPPKNALA